MSKKWTAQEESWLQNCVNKGWKPARISKYFQNSFGIVRSTSSIRKKIQRMTGISSAEVVAEPVIDVMSVDYKAKYEEAQRLIAELRNQTTATAEEDQTPLDILVIGDAHVEPNQDLSRFELLAHFAADQRPDIIVAIGDWFGLTSLCTYNSRLEVEGVRVVEDIKAGNDAIALFEKTLAEVAPDYKPRKIYTMGNHDHRLDRVAEEDPRLFGLVGTHLMDWTKHGWEVYPFLAPFRANGFRFQHYLCATGGRRAIAGVYQGRKLLQAVNHEESVVVGHGHVLHNREEGLASGKRVHAIQVGKFFTHHEEYAGEDSNNRWWTGLVMLRECVNSQCDVDTWSWPRLVRNYMN